MFCVGYDEFVLEEEVFLAFSFFAGFGLESFFHLNLKITDALLVGICDIFETCIFLRKAMEYCF